MNAWRARDGAVTGGSELRKLTRRTISAALPGNEGRETTSDFRIEGNTLVVTSPGANRGMTEVRLRRLK